MGDIELAGFAIDGLLGRGGMADVWRGRHRASGQPAAIKVIARDRALDPGFQAGLRREVRAVAGLDHPGIVPVLDAGTVPDAIAGATDGRLVAGSPWLAMVLAEHGDLNRLPRPLPWPVLRDVLLQILDALAHAHARDVIHRDLKPGNVLLQLDGDRLRVMLTDFGIAHVIDPGTDGSDQLGAVGTPEYMAPEQLRGQWRDFGPWTDLYALGCMAFELAAGAPPYAGTGPLATATLHLTGEVPRLAPLRGTPAGFVDWVRRLMDRAPDARFPTAADAAWALSRLPAPSADAERAARRVTLQHLAAAAPGDEIATVIDGSLAGLAPTAALSPTMAIRLPPPSAMGAGSTGDAADAVPEHLPIPETWYVDRPRRPLLSGVGLGLFGVRAQPLVGRSAERTVLWDALRRVRRDRRAELVLLDGAEGVGKTALAEWFARRIREVGGAAIARFRFGPMDGAGDGFAAGLNAWFRGHGLDRDALVERIRLDLARRAPSKIRLIEEVVAPSIARVITDSGDDVSLSPAERRTAQRTWLTLITTRRPVVLLLDDLHWGADAMGFVEWLLERGLDAPVLIVATAPEDTWAVGSERTAQLARLAERARRITIGPLSEKAHHAAMQDLLGLCPRLSDAVRRHAAGNPLFAGQIVADWVEQGVLLPTPTGYDLPPGHPPDIPRDLDELAVRRVARIAPTPMAHSALHIAAALGNAVHRGEWQAACAGLGIKPPTGLEGALQDAGLVIRAPEGFVFAHGFVRAALGRAGRASGRWTAMHRACAAAVTTGRSPAERRVWHLLKAEAFTEAIDALLAAIRLRMDASDYRGALTLIGIRDGLMERVGAGPHDVRRAAGMALRIDALRFSSRPDEARAALAAFDQLPVGPEHPGILADRARARAGILSFDGGLRPHFDAYQDAVALYRAAGDVRGEVRALHGLGWNQIIQARYARAAGLMMRSRDLARSAGLRLDEGWADQGLMTARAFGHLPGVQEALRAAEQAFADVRSPIGRAMVLADRAELALLADDIPKARRFTEAAAEFFEGIGSQLVFRTRVSLVLIELAEGHAQRAMSRIVPLLDDLTLDAMPRLHRYGVSALGALVAAHAGDHARFDAYLKVAESDPDRRFLAPSTRRDLIRLAEYLDAQRRPADAARVWRLAADHWRVVDVEKTAMCRARADAASRA